MWLCLELRQLVKAKAKVELEASSGATALALAARNQDEEMRRCLALNYMNYFAWLPCGGLSMTAFGR